MTDKENCEDDSSDKRDGGKVKCTAFQSMNTWRPYLLTETAVFSYAAIGFVTLAIGLALEIILSRRIPEEIIIDYTDNACYNSTNMVFCKEAVKNKTWVDLHGPCKCDILLVGLGMGMIAKDIKFYYGFNEFYQSYPDYFRSRDDYQLKGISIEGSESCEPLTYFDLDNNITNETKKIPYAPCGLIADSLFNDTFSLEYKASDQQDPQQTIIKEVPMSFKGIAPKYLFGAKFANPIQFKDQDFWNKTRKPRSWSTDFYEKEFAKYGYKYEPLIVWLRLGPFNTFRKVYAKLNCSDEFFEKGLPKGTYSLTVTYNFPVAEGGKKRFIIGADSGRRHRLLVMAWAYQLLSLVMFALSLFLMVVDLKWCKLQKSVNRFIIKNILIEADSKEASKRII